MFHNSNLHEVVVLPQERIDSGERLSVLKPLDRHANLERDLLFGVTREFEELTFSLNHGLFKKALEIISHRNFREFFSDNIRLYRIKSKEDRGEYEQWINITDQLDAIDLVDEFMLRNTFDFSDKRLEYFGLTPSFLEEIPVTCEYLTQVFVCSCGVSDCLSANTWLLIDNGKVTLPFLTWFVSPYFSLELDLEFLDDKSFRKVLGRKKKVQSGFLVF